MLMASAGFGDINRNIAAHSRPNQSLRTLFFKNNTSIRLFLLLVTSPSVAKQPATENAINAGNVFSVPKVFGQTGFSEMM